MRSFSKLQPTVSRPSESPMAEERSPLLATPPNSHTTLCKRRTPLPVKQLFVLCIMRLTEPISYTLIFPFINRMLEDMKVSPDPKQIGYYAGVIESLFAVAQMCTAVFWGRLSDHVGRKPVMLFGLFGMAISVISFGLQSTYTGLIISRFVAGMMNGNIGIIQSIVAEITDATNYADTVAYLPLCYAIGSILGPIIGGFLALPAEKYPALFGASGLMINHPYFLPCFMGGLLNLLAIGLGIFFLEETLPSKRKHVSRFQGQGPQRDDILGTLTDRRQDRPPKIASLCTYPIMITMLTFIIMHLQNVAWNAVIPLYAYTEIINGGLGMSLEQIGSVLSVGGFGIIVTQLLIFPPLQRRIGVVSVLKCTITCFTLSYLCVPFVTWSTHLESSTPGKRIAYMVMIMILRSPGSMCYVSIMMITKLLSPSAAALGTLNGMQQTCSAFAQVIGPIVGSSLFAMGISSGVLGGNLVWIVLALTATISQLCCYKISLPNSKDEGVSSTYESDYGACT
ncbi:major facilitator superfamily domain-containing protein [Melampsora americana]|nr:major facilitator superfamily domain-containing protein [Melampsora americana]